ncbi:MAG: hypothetical protein EXR72_27230 [Myxococcales bacterium]|nr:hypothetical protein [Myxococcales bacterium]
MSIRFTLQKFVDPVQHATEEAERRFERQRPQRDEDGGPPGGPAPGEATFACRVCDHRSTEGAFCPRCLADTMQPIRCARAPRRS